MLGASEHLLDCEVLLYELEERTQYPLMPIYVGYLQPIEFQTVNDVRDNRSRSPKSGSEFSIRCTSFGYYSLLDLYDDTVSLQAKCLVNVKVLGYYLILHLARVTNNAFSLSIQLSAWKST